MANWSNEIVAGRPLEVLVPSSTPREGVIWLHGYDGQPLRGRSVCERAFLDENLLVVAPSGGQSWWLDQPCPGFEPPLTPARFVLEAVIDWMASRWSLASPAIGLAGVGMGGQGAVNLGFRHARRFPVVTAIAPDIDFHQWHGHGTPLDQMFPSREAARQQTATLHLHPLNWTRHLLLMCDPQDPVAWEGTERLASKLISSGVPFETDFEPRGGGHSWNDFEARIPAAARFLGQHLRSAREAAAAGLT